MAVTGARTLRRVLHNSGVLIGGDVAGKVFRFGAALVLARALGPSNFGILNVGIAAAGILTIVAALGLPDVAGREVAVSAGDSAAIGGRVLAARLSVAAIGGSAALGVVVLVDPHWALLAAAALALAVIGGCSLDWQLRARARVRPVAVATGVAGAAALLTAAIAALSGGGPAVALGGFATAEAIAAWICWRACSPSERPRLQLGGVKPLLRVSWPVAVSGFAFYIYYANFDTIVLATAHSTAEAGVYSGAYRVFLGLNIVGAYVAYASLPFLSRLLAEPTGRELADHLLESTVARLSAYGILVVGAAMLLGTEALGLLFGDRYRSASGAFILLSVALAWYSATYPVGYALIAERRNAAYMAGALVGGSLNITLCLLIIPWAGMIGAAAATVVSFAAAGVVWLWQRGLSQSLWLVASLIGLTGLASCAVAIPGTKAPLGAAVVAVGLAAALWIRRHAPLGAEAPNSVPSTLADSIGPAL